jgi:hypothetical protein
LKRIIAILAASLAAAATNFATTAIAGSWEPIPGIKLLSVSVVDAQTIFGVTPDGGLLRRSGDQWLEIDTQGQQLVQVAGHAETLYAVNADGRLLRRSGDQWFGVDPPPPGPVFAIAVSAQTAELYALTRDGLFRRSGDSWLGIEAPELASFALGRDNEIWAVTSDGQLLRRSGDAWQSVEAPTLDRIAAGGDEVFGIGGNNVFRRSGDTWSFVRGPRMADLSVGSDGATWSVGPTDAADNTWEFSGDE